MVDDHSSEAGWPARAFEEGVRDYLLVEAQVRVREQLAHISAQDVKTAALFTASAALLTVSGLLGETRLAFTSPAVLTILAFCASLITWFLLGLAYWTREVGAGVNLEIIRDHDAGASERELRDVVLESAVEDFTLNQQTIVAGAVEEQTELPATDIQTTEETQSSASSFNGAR